jgi:uncharacterized membrane-anchored protein YjiN (DUF445 family)
VPKPPTVRIQSEHYRIADNLLVEGTEVVAKISALNDKRQALVDECHDRLDLAVRDEQIRAFTSAMDEYGKKAMGIWAQATAHALLAQTVGHVVKDARSES